MKPFRLYASPSNLFFPWLNSFPFWFIPFLLLFTQKPLAGITNPDLSAVGQLLGGMTDDANDLNTNEPTLRLGESEIVLSAALNPYLNGVVNLSGDEEGVGIEEAYASLVRGLPWNFGMKAGKYRLGFGKLNAAHPHTYPFIETPHAWQSLIPGGEEGFNEAAVQVSQFLTLPGDWASTWSFDVIEAKAFHPGQEKSRLGGLGHWQNAFSLGDTWALEFGASGAIGADEVTTSQWGSLWGVDFKSKWYLVGESQLTLQAEGCWRHSEVTGLFDSTFAPGQDRQGFYAFADYKSGMHWNTGILVEQWNSSENASLTDRALKVFAGYSLLEESTVLRLALERQFLAGAPDIHSLSLQLLFSMGPHKAHNF